MYFQFSAQSVPDVSMLQQSAPPPPPPQAAGALPPPPPPPPPVAAPPPCNPGNRQLNHQVSSPAIVGDGGRRHEDPTYAQARGRQRGAPEPTYAHHGPPGLTQAQLNVQQYGMTNTTPSPPQSSSGYSGSSNRANSGSHHSTGGGSGGGGSYPPPPPPNIAPPPPAPTSDYEEPDA